MIPPEDQEREGGESAEAMGALETLLLSLGAGALVGLATYAPKAVNKAAAALRRAANKAVADSMAGVNAAVERDLVGALVLEAVTEADHLGEGKRRSKLVKAARAEGRKAARQTRRRMRKYAACMVDDLNAKFLREAARSKVLMLSGANHRKAMAEAVARMAKDGLTAYTYERKDGATVHVPVDVGVRRALQSAGQERQIDQALAVAAAAGANMVEVSTTAGARKSHAEWQGKRYLIKGSSAKYPNFAKACKRGDPVDGIGGYNCRHQIAVCREGDPPRFKDPLEGTGYSQERARAALTAQRGMENDLRKLKRQREVLKQNGLSTKEIDARIKAVDKGIDEFVARHSKILKRDRHRESIYERARKAVGAEGKVWLNDGQRKAVSKAASKSAVDGKIKWPGRPRKMTAKEYRSLVERANRRGVGLHSSFEGAYIDAKAAETMIDAAGEALERVPILKRLPEGRSITLMVDHSMSDNDFAQVFPNKPWLIHLNASAMRSLDAIEREYGKLADGGWFVKGTTAKAIVYHELGHCIEKLLKVDSVSVAHGIIGERNEELLRASVAGSLSRYAARKTAKGRKTVFGEEIMPEVISAWLSGVDNEFAKKFASLIGLV